jgi:hypothetical protein
MNIHFMTRLFAALCLLASVQGARAQETEAPPSWPRQFSVQGPEVASFGFVLTQPGPIVVDIQVDGAPVLASLDGPTQSVAQQQGSGSLRLVHTATPNEVQNSAVWIVGVKLAEPGRNVAKGIVNVQHPPVDQARVLAATRAFKAQAQARRAQLDSAGAQQMAQLKAQMDAELRKQNAQLEEQNAQRRSALMAQLQPAVERLRAGSVATSGPPRVTTRAVAPSGMPTRQSAAAITRPDRTAILKDAPVSSSQPLTAAGPGGNIQNVAPNPGIASLSAVTGRPGDPILISGSGFGNTMGEVHFVLGPANDIRVPETPSQVPAGLIWSDSQIFVTVPNVSGLRAFNGTVYVTRGGDQVRSNLTPFSFVPLMERRHIVKPITTDALLAVTGVPGHFWPLGDPDRVGRSNGDCFSGSTGNDRFFSNTRLQNGWRVLAAPTVQYTRSYWMGGDAFLADSRVGTDWPYVDVKWSVNIGPYCYSAMSYSFVIPIEGPLNTPDGVVVR